MPVSMHLLIPVNIDYYRCMVMILEVADVSAPACCRPLVRAPMSAADAEHVAVTLKALADPARLRLLSIAGRLATTGRRAWLHLARPAPFTGLALDGRRRLDARAAPG